MANHKSALKRARQNEVKRIRNKGHKTRAKKAIKTVRNAIAENSLETSREKLSEAVSILQKTGSKGIIHRNTASRKISRLSRQINRLSS